MRGYKSSFKWHYLLLTSSICIYVVLAYHLVKLLSLCVSFPKFTPPPSPVIFLHLVSVYYFPSRSNFIFFFIHCVHKMKYLWLYSVTSPTAFISNFCRKVSFLLSVCEETVNVFTKWWHPVAFAVIYTLNPICNLFGADPSGQHHQSLNEAIS